MPSADATPSTRPYLIRALHEWCTDHGFSPHLAVQVDASVQVPREYVKNDEIVLNVSFDATSGLKLGNEYIEFKARFGGVARDIIVPVTHVVAIYARENGQGMAFPAPVVAPPAPAVVDAADEPGDGKGLQLVHSEPGSPPESDEPPPASPPGNGRPALKRVK